MRVVINKVCPLHGVLTDNLTDNPEEGKTKFRMRTALSCRTVTKESYNRGNEHSAMLPSSTIMVSSTGHGVSFIKY